MQSTRTTSIAPVFPLSAGDRAAQRASTHYRGDSDPDMDEALRRATAAVELIEAERQAAVRAEIEAAYAEYADQPLAEYHEYLGSAA